MTSPFLGDAKTMTQQELENALEGLAQRWRNEPYLSNEWSDGVRYGELKDALKDRFKVEKQIRAVGENTVNYQVV